MQGRSGRLVVLLPKKVFLFLSLSVDGGELLGQYKEPKKFDTNLIMTTKIALNARSTQRPEILELLADLEFL